MGIFSKACLIEELYEGLCFCCSSILPDVVGSCYIVTVAMVTIALS